MRHAAECVADLLLRGGPPGRGRMCGTDAGDGSVDDMHQGMLTREQRAQTRGRGVSKVGQHACLGGRPWPVRIYASESRGEAGVGGARDGEEREEGVEHGAAVLGVLWRDEVDVLKAELNGRVVCDGFNEALHRFGVSEGDSGIVRQYPLHDFGVSLRGGVSETARGYDKIDLQVGSLAWR